MRFAIPVWLQPTTYNSSRVGSHVLPGFGGSFVSNIDKKSCTRSAAAIPVISAEKATLPSYGFERGLSGTYRCHTQVLLLRCQLLWRRADISVPFLFDGRSSHLHEVQTSKSSDDTLDLASCPTSRFWGSSYRCGQDIAWIEGRQQDRLLAGARPGSIAAQSSFWSLTGCYVDIPITSISRLKEYQMHVSNSG